MTTRASSSAIDKAMDALVVPGFTRLGPALRSRLGHWPSAAAPSSMAGRTAVVTGATSGIGLVVARDLAAAGAAVWLVGRDAGRLASAVETVSRDVPGSVLRTAVADMADLDAVRALADLLLTEVPVLDVLVHNAGALSAEKRLSPQGIEETVAAQVVGPHLLTSRLLPRLTAAHPGRVVTVSSGGMYASPLRVDDIEMGADYGGSEQYARAKRAQVVLNEMWAQRTDPGDVVFHAMHPGWADTPGVRTSLPAFRRVVGPLLRSAAEGADTVVWLAASPEAASGSGGFWCDRAIRPTHRLSRTRRSDTPAHREELWAWVEGATQRMR
jgi:dehydrogenase/reductase SDR family protein 12